MISDAARVLLNHAPPDFERLWTDRIAWRLTAHKYQVPPPGEWIGWMMRGGRGIGKTLTGARDVAEHCLDYPGLRYGIVAPTLGDAREIVLEGETGLINVLTVGVTIGDTYLPGMGLVEDTDFTYNRSLREVEFANGSHVKAFGSERPDRLRGPNHHRLWFEELASFKDAWKGDALQTTYNNAMLGNRLRPKPGWRPFAGTRHIITTTPRRVKLITDLSEDETVVVTTGTTYHNLPNLDPNFARQLLKYEGTHLGRQELLGEIVTEVPGALWRVDMIEPHRLEPRYDETTESLLPVWPTFQRILVGVDPSGGADEIGIVLAGKIHSPCPCGNQTVTGPHYAVIADWTTNGSPEAWGRRVVSAYHEFKADRVIAERNFGGDMVESTLRTADRNVPVKTIPASRGKDQRAEPVSAVYEQGRVHHLGGFPKLEDEYTTYVKGEADWSPNRMDAAVWALTELGLESGTTGVLRDRSVSTVG